MPKFHALIDTNIYRKNPSRTDLAFQALERLCKQGVVKLHLPYIVEREFQTQQISQYKQALDSALHGIDTVIRKGLSPEQTARVKAIRDELSEAVPAILKDVESGLPSWAESIGAQRHAITEQQATAAMESYFHGKPPLKTPKIRDDIPDAFIFQNILQLSVTDKPLVVIAEDEKMALASEVIPEVTVYRSLSEFIESAPVQAEILDLDVVANLDNVATELRTYEQEVSAISIFIKQNAGDALVWKQVYSLSIPDDSHEATITSYSDPDDIELNFDELYYFGHGEFGLPFTFTNIVNIMYYIFKSDYYLMEMAPSVSDHNDHYFEAEDEIEVRASGLMKLTIDPEVLKIISADTLEKSLSISIDSIDGVEMMDRSRLGNYT